MAYTSPTFDPVIVAVQLVGISAEQEAGFTSLDKELQKPLVARLRQRFPGLTSEDLADCWQECLEGVWVAIQKQQFDQNRPLEPWVWTILYNRAASRLRKVTTVRRVLEAVGTTLAETELGGVWNQADPAERLECISEIRQAILQLPLRQRQVWQAFVDGFPETADLDVLCEHASELAKEPLTHASVKRAKQEGQKKLKEILAHKGLSPRVS